jgi:hypothetical protein
MMEYTEEENLPAPVLALFPPSEAVVGDREEPLHPIYVPVIEDFPQTPTSPRKRGASWRRYSKKVRDVNWLVKELEQEVDAAKPQPEDIDEQKNRNTGRLAEEFSKIFYAGRVFYNFYQLNQMVQRFADSWGFEIYIDAFFIKCSFANLCVEATCLGQNGAVLDGDKALYEIGIIRQSIASQKKCISNLY